MTVLPGWLRSYRDFNECEPPHAVVFPFTLKMGTAVTDLYLGDRDRALDGIRAVIAGTPATGFLSADLARDHFEDTLRFEDANASRLYQPAMRFWFGRHLAARADADSRARGVALLTEAADQFAQLGMVIHQQQAARELKSVSV